jgi:hypothetical protein
MVNGAIEFQHTGNTDPTAGGWTHVIGGGGFVSTGPVTNDLALGIDAWFVEDTGTGSNTAESYSQTPSGGQIAEASSKGWALTMNLRMVTGTTGSFFGMFVDYIDGTTQWALTFDVDANGDPVVRTIDGASNPTHTLVGAGSTYHTYSLRFDPLAGSADLFVDGVEQISNYTGNSIALTRVAWGAAGSNATGRGHFQSVEWEIIPEPTTLVIWSLLATLGLSFGWRRRRRA